MTTADNERDVLELVQRWAAAARMGDPELLDGLLAEDFAWAGPSAASCTGPAARPLPESSGEPGLRGEGAATAQPRRRGGRDRSPGPGDQLPEPRQLRAIPGRTRRRMPCGVLTLTNVHVGPYRFRPPHGHGIRLPPRPVQALRRAHRTVAPADSPLTELAPADVDAVIVNAAGDRLVTRWW